MKKRWFYMLSILLLFSLLHTVPCFASEQPAVLSLDDAVSSAYRFSDQMSLNTQENELLREQLKALEGSSYVTYQTAYLTKAQNEQQRQILEYQIAYDITNRYYNLILLQKELDSLDKTIALNAQKLQEMALQKQLGVVSKTDYDAASLKLETEKNTRNAKMESLVNSAAYFKILTAKDPLCYLLDDSLAFEPFRISGSIDSYIQGKTEEYLKYQKEILQLQSDNILVAGAPAMPWVTYLGQKYSMDQKSSELENAEQNLHQALMTSYASLLSCEEQIRTVQNQLKLATSQAATAKCQYALGLITSSDYTKQLLTVSDTEYNLRKLIYNYNELKIFIQKPWSAG